MSRGNGVPSPAGATTLGRMKVLRDPQIISGFLYEAPVDDLPALTHCGEAICCRGHARPLHAHAGFEFLYLSRGTCHWQVGGTHFRQEMGDLFITLPGEPHRTGPKPNPENRHLWLGLRLERLGPAAARLGKELRRRRIRLLPACQDVEALLQALVGQVMALRPHRAEVAASLIHAFIALVTQHVEGSAPDTQPARPVLPYSLAVRKVIAYMNKNMDRRISLRDFAAAATLRSTTHLCAIFRREVGMSPGAYHLLRRLEAARETLRQPSATITHVALQFGFSSSQHFSFLFRRAFGITPQGWMRRG